MPTRFRSLTLLLASALFLSLSGCLGSNGNGASFTLGVKDTPVDGASSVMIDFTGVDLMGPNGLQSFTFPGGWPINLLHYQGVNTAVLLTNAGIDPGNYQWIRLNIDPSKSYLIASDGNTYPLTMPSGSATGLKIATTFSATKGQDANFVIDFNLRNSITESTSSGGTPVYTLSPTLQLIPVVKTGFIKGTVAPTLTVGGTPISATSCYPAVYVYFGAPATLGGFKATVSGATQPLTSTTPDFDTTTGNYDYSFAYLQPGTYTLAVTCAGADVAGASSLAFSTTQTATVQTNYISPTNF